jgi:hypothetical protein
MPLGQVDPSSVGRIAARGGTRCPQRVGSQRRALGRLHRKTPPAAIVRVLRQADANARNN